MPSFKLPTYPTRSLRLILKLAVAILTISIIQAPSIQASSEPAANPSRLAQAGQVTIDFDSFSAD